MKSNFTEILLVGDTLIRADARPYRTDGYDEALTSFSPIYDGVLKKGVHGTESPLKS